MSAYRIMSTVIMFLGLVEFFDYLYFCISEIKQSLSYFITDFCNFSRENSN